MWREMGLCLQTSNQVQTLHATSLLEAIRACSSTWMLNLISSYCGEAFSSCLVSLGCLSLHSCWYFCCAQCLLLSCSLFGNFFLEILDSKILYSSACFFFLFFFNCWQTTTNEVKFLLKCHWCIHQKHSRNCYFWFAPTRPPGEFYNRK